MAESSSSSNNYGSWSPITHMAQDHLFSILLLLPIDSILSLSMTCKRLKSITYSDTLWESICRRDWGPTSVDAIKSSSAAAGTDSRHHHLQLPWMESIDRSINWTLSLAIDYLNQIAMSPSQGPELLIPSILFLGAWFCLVGVVKEVAYKLLERAFEVSSDLLCQRSSVFQAFSQFLFVYASGLCFPFLGRHLDDTWVAYIGNDFKKSLNWQKINSGVPSGRFGHSCVVVDDFIVLFGGINDHGIRQNDTWVGQVALNETFGVTLSWRLLDVGSTTPPPRGAHAGCCIDNKRMLIHGGIGLSGLRVGDTWVRRKDDFWLLDISSIPSVEIQPITAKRKGLVGNMWKRLKSRGYQPNCRSFHRACADQSGCYLYVYGGMVDGLLHPAEGSGLRFDGELFLVELALQL
ncbi:hypothetical protein C3L33_00034, partial [Rhododendron williamsianum]